MEASREERIELGASKNVSAQLFSYSYDFKQNPSVDFIHTTQNSQVRPLLAPLLE